ncbi:XRE family transcriptional regulator [Micromonospora sp. KC207]|uniref:helix-turn-helix domain-containing protein n=1 Tax=Micromonospora sp. KC207 TaxID=2530377 RepID=UPI001044F1AC|nr:helix-turn-helix transcriptional regulator [Micromonospora sp. KC207]TDC59105.1 XRE family transcriptional regulator [Micromonospora sp. KC207]
MKANDVVEESSLAARIGARLRSLRKARGLTLANLAEQSGISVSYLSAVEKGVNLPSLQTLAGVTEALGASIPAVLAEEGQTHVKAGRVPAEPTVVDTAHPLLQLRTTILHARAGDHGESPVPTDDHDLFVFVQHGQISLSLAGGDYLLGDGDALDAKNPGKVSWRAEDQCVAVWAACPSRIL